MVTMNISLPTQMKSWVEERSDGAEFANSSDYVRHLIRRDQERRAAIAELQALVTEGLDSGDAGPVDFNAFRAEMRAKHGL